MATSNELGPAAPDGIPRHRIHQKGKSLEEDLPLLVESVTWGAPGAAQQSQAYTIEFPLDRVRAQVELGRVPPEQTGSDGSQAAKSYFDIPRARGGGGGGVGW